ncbi:MAG: phosphatidylglycerophosphatase A [Chitinophagaceae bacterium]|nr:phosphatidylglycerophosphatase A [Chitinophagaceae bacterium]
MQLQKLTASVAGIGKIKGGGTIAAVVYCIIWFLLPASFCTNGWQVISTAAILIVGVWSSNCVDGIWGKDSSKVVIDEVAGMAVTLLYIPHHIIFLLTGLILFRFFDIVKPLGIRQMEKLPAGWGVMADDVLAGVYSLMVLQLIIFISAAYFK